MKNLLSALFLSILLFAQVPVIAGDTPQSQPPEEAIYFQIFDTDGNLLTEKDVVEIGDIIIDKNFNEYKIIFINNEEHSATAEFVQSLEKPTVKKNITSQISTQTVEEKKIGLYSTHNDESYIIGDNTESVYGKGGIHDIGMLLAEKLEEKNIKTTYNQTLHIPHNSSAYSRSRTTAKQLLEENNTAIFDIHRDAASRNFYLANYANKNVSKVRIVVGQNNKNKDQNLQFAMWLVSVANKLYPWMIADIYYGKNTYNQDLSNKALLFEMGCHNIEKEYVKNTVPYLADVINTTLFNTTVEEENNNLSINNNQAQTNQTIDEFLTQQEEQKNSPFSIILPISIFSIILITLIFCIYKKTHNNKKIK